MPATSLKHGEFCYNSSIWASSPGKYLLFPLFDLQFYFSASGPQKQGPPGNLQGVLSAFRPARRFSVARSPVLLAADVTNAHPVRLNLPEPASGGLRKAEPLIQVLPSAWLARNGAGASGSMAPDQFAAVPW